MIRRLIPRPPAITFKTRPRRRLVLAILIRLSCLRSTFECPTGVGPWAGWRTVQRPTKQSLQQEDQLCIRFRLTDSSPMHGGQNVKGSPPVENLCILWTNKKRPDLRPTSSRPALGEADSRVRSPGYPLHTGGPAYGCSLPRLTGFTGLRLSGARASNTRALRCQTSEAPRRLGGEGGIRTLEASL